MKRILPLIILISFSSPAQAITWKEFWEPFRGDHHHYYRPRPHYRGESEICTKEVYKEEYVPGDIYRPGYVRRWRDSFRVPCR